jgi:SAM-dependent methyltransferase
MVLWQEILPRRYGVLERFNHGYPVKQRSNRTGRIRTLEIGAGYGEHLKYEDISNQEYYSNELRPEMAKRIAERFPSAKVIVGDCQERLPFEEGFFDRILAIHVLEHLRNLPAALMELRRVMKPDGEFSIVIPCEGGWAYNLARDISTRRIFEKRFNMPYDWWIESEHVNMPEEIIEEISVHFEIVDRTFFPFWIPVFKLNLVVGITMRRRP